jgi:hypothetical protein
LFLFGVSVCCSAFAANVFWSLSRPPLSTANLR